jgi:hypothetical protein
MGATYKIRLKRKQQADPEIGTKFADGCDAAAHDPGMKRHSVQTNSLLDTG